MFWLVLSLKTGGPLWLLLKIEEITQSSQAFMVFFLTLYCWYRYSRGVAEVFARYVNILFFDSAICLVFCVAMCWLAHHIFLMRADSCHCEVKKSKLASVNNVHPSNKMLIFRRKKKPPPHPPLFFSIPLKGYTISCLWKGKSPFNKACEWQVWPMQALVFLFIRGCFYSALFDRASSPFPSNWVDWGHFLNGLLFTLQS